MSETPRDQRGLWSEVSRSFEELGDALRVHLSADAARSPSDPTAAGDSTSPPPAPDPAAPRPSADAWGEATAADAQSPVPDPHAPPAADAGPAAGPSPTTGPGSADDVGSAAGADHSARTGGRPGRFATSADWDSARESVRDLGRNAQRIASQAGDAARDQQVRDSAQRAARSIGDAIVTTMEDFAADLRSRMRNPRWSDPDQPRPAEPPPIAPVEDDPKTP